MSSSGAKSVSFAPETRHAAAPKSSSSSRKSAAPAATAVHASSDCGLAVQDLATLDISKLTPLSPEVISRQATLNIGTIGHVAHGKSTVVKAITGVKVRFTGCGAAVVHSHGRWAGLVCARLPRSRLPLPFMS